MTESRLAAFESLYIPEPNTGCWLWTGSKTTGGYGLFSNDRKLRLAHRVIFEHVNGIIGVSKVIDHKCRMKCCVNPDHMEAVTQKENIRRSLAHRRSNSRTLLKKRIAIGHCPIGHDDIENLGRKANGTSYCKECNRIRNRHYYERNKQGKR